MQRAYPILLIFLTVILTGSCGNLSTQPKKFGSVIDLDPTDTANSDNFRFLYSYRDDTVSPSAVERVVQLKGVGNSNAAIVSTCNSAGTGCYCDFYNGTTLMGTSDAGASGIGYSSSQGILRCIIPAAIADGSLPNITAVTVRNSDSSLVSDPATLLSPSTTNITLAQILSGYDANKLRTVYKYKCKRNFLQKAATIYPGFDCTTQVAGADQGGTDFSLLQLDFTYFLYGGNTGTNFADKMIDLLYNSGSSGSVCNQQIKQYDCVNTVTANAGLPSKLLGIYETSSGIFSTQITLNVSPLKKSVSFGYVAARIEFPSGSGTYVCPPGLSLYDSYTTQIDSGDFTTISNMPDKDIPGDEAADATDTEVSLATSTPTAITPQQVQGGACTTATSTCTFPSTAIGAYVPAVTYNYAAASSQFCAIPGSLLP